MKNIYEYIILNKTDRQQHLNLDMPCIERGGNPKTIATLCKGLLAYILDTTIPSGMKIQLCHACHNSLCSNPYHLYWGTAKENTQDRIDNGTQVNIWNACVEKYGYEKTLEMSRNHFRKANEKSKNNRKGKRNSEDHNRKISETLTGRKRSSYSLKPDH